MKKLKILLLLVAFILIPVGVKAEELTDEQLWASFVEKYKTTELVTSAADGVLDITSTSDSMKVVLNDESGSFSFSFNYADGILTYVPSDIKSLDYSDSELVKDKFTKLFNEDLMVMNSMLALADLKGYDQSVFDSTVSMSDAEGIITLEEDGIEVAVVEYNEEYSDENSSSSFTTSIITSYKLDLRNGLNIESILKKIDTINSNTPTEGETVTITPIPPADCEDDNGEVVNNSDSTKEEVVDNPDTGIFGQYGIALAVVVGLGTLGYFGIRKHNKFPQV